MPVRFDCHSCREPWWAPPGNGCPRCGYAARATPDPIVWEVGRVPNTPILVSGQMRDSERFAAFVRRGIGSFIDVAGDASYVWRPDDSAVQAAGVAYVRIPLEDTNVELAREAFTAVAEALEQADGNALVFCAAGLKRAPHLVYGVLRLRGDDRSEAWAKVAAARPMTEPFQPYIDSAERWLASAGELLLDRPL